RVAVYYTCERIALFKLLKWIDKSAKDGRRAEAAEAKKEGGTISTQTGSGLANWKNKMYLEVLHSSFTPERDVVAVGEDPFSALRTAVLQEKHAFFFATGCCVFWGLTREEEARRLMMLTPFSSGMMDQVEAQDMEFSYGDRSSIAKDAIVLCTTSVAEKIALSFAMSQSATLGAFETRVEDRIRSTKHIPSSLASVGSIQYSQDDTSKLIGQLFIELADVNIHSNILDEPDYFLKSQDDDDFKYLYEKMLKYQDVASRVAILNKRLSILRDLVGVLNQQLTHHQGAKLEWIIIWMLVFQVIIAIGWEILLKDILGYFHWG
ncbi:membrane protein, partial [Phytophthora palmivora]